MYAKSGNTQEKQPLIDHLIVAMKMAKCCADELGIDDQKIVDMIELAAFCHDVGKCTDFFQNITLSSLQDEDKKTLINKLYPNIKEQHPRHNEISWMYCALRANKSFSSLALQAIYWHHGTFLYQDEIEIRNSNIIWQQLSKFEDPKEIFNKINDLLNQGKKYFSFDIEKYFEILNEENVKVQKIFEAPLSVTTDIKNSHRLLIRSCIVRADHITSSLTCVQLKDIIENDNAQLYFNKSKAYELIDVSCPESYQQERFQTQQNCVLECEKTTIVKAPAGAGKTIIGIMWALQKHKQVYWVCPRNSVAEGVYKNIIEELRALNLTNDVSVELFLTSERKECTHESLDVCTSRIIVTNIDNLLSPMVAHKDVKRIFDINNSFVILDEFHEYLSLEEDEALLAAFITYMRARNLCCKNTQTLLLSATPTILHMLWDSGKNPTKLLPNKNEHYPAQHKKEYFVSCENEFITTPSAKSLTMYLAIKNVQEYFKQNYTQICHSKYTKEDRKKTFEYLLDKFGKNGNKEDTVISAPILQAALDISFNELYKSSESPESDVQTIGRINRWGEINNVCNLHMLDLKHNARERSATQNRYDLSLSRKWYEFLQENIKEKSLITLDELYVLYNDFNNQFNKDINDFIVKKLEESFKQLCYFYPKQTNFKKKVNDNKTYTAKTLRSSTTSYFIVIKDQNNNWINSTFTISNKEFDEKCLTEETGIYLNNKAKLSKLLEKLENQSDIFDYTDVLKQLHKKKVSIIYELKKFAKCSASPIPVLSHQYDSIIGLIER
jgi:CRISPR-associated endonuclease/helicase Cas3